MIQTIVRVLGGLAGAFGLYMAVNFWIDPVGPGAQLGVQAMGDLGLSTLRADFAAFFGVGGLFAVAMAVRNDGRLALVPLGLFALALIGRLITAGGHGLPEAVIPPIAVETAFSVLFLIAWRVLPRRA